MDQRIYDLLARVNAETDDVRRAQLQDETAEELGLHFSRNMQEFDELAYDLLNNAWGDAGQTGLLDQIIDVKTVGLGDPDYFDEDLRGMHAYWQGKGGQIRSGLIRYERAQMPREEMVWAIDVHWDELRLDFWGAFPKLAQQARDKMAVLPVERLIELIQAGITTGHAQYGQFAASTLTTDQILSVVNPVAARSGNATILGTPVAIRKAAARVALEWGDNVKEQFFRTGMVGLITGYPTAQVENFENFEGNLVLPDDELWVVGRRAGKLTYYGAEAKVQTLALPSFQRRTESARDAGMLLVTDPAKARIGRIKLT